MGAHASGRAPDVYWFDPTCDRVAGLGPGYTAPRAVRAMRADLDVLPLYLGSAADVVVVGRRPAAGFLERLLAAGFPTPEFVVCPPGAGVPAELRRRPLNRLRPWGWSPVSAAWAEPLFGQLPAGTAQRPGSAWNDAVRRLYSKTWSAAFLARFLAALPQEASRLCDPGSVGVTCAGLQEVEAVAAQIRAGRGTGVLLKVPFGAAGQDQVRLGPPPGPLWRDGAQRRQAARLLDDQGALVVEPLFDRVADLSCHLEIGAPGEADVVGLSRFATDGRGHYLGSILQPLEAGLDEEARRFLGGGAGGAGGPGLLARVAAALATQLSAELAPTGYTGPLGIDAIVYRAADGLRLRPVVEVNGRYTMGRVALALATRVRATRTALWLVLRVRDLAAAGFAGALDFARSLEVRHPVRLSPDDGRVDAGALCTNDPGAARSVLSVLVVAESLAGCGEVLAAVAPWCRWVPRAGDPA